MQKFDFTNNISHKTVSICNVNSLMTNSSIEYAKSIVIDNFRLNMSNISMLGNTFAANLLFKFIIGTNLRSPQLSDSFRKNMTMTIQDMLISCVYNSIICTADDFFWYYDILYGYLHKILLFLSINQ